MTSKLARMVSHTLVIIAACVVAVAAVGCSSSGGGSTDTYASEGPDEGVERQFTAAELAEFDGGDGRPAYVAVDGVVYDVSDSTLWPQGSHSRCNLGASAGQDLSDVILQAPQSMRALLERMPVVGSLTE